MKIPNYVEVILNRLEEFGFEAYIVGGALRNALLGLAPTDYDICTSCDVETMLEIFSDLKIVNNNGQKHNTITINVDGDNVEISSFRHTKTEDCTLKNDLSHRDLTINAMVYRKGELIDLFDGALDLKNEIIRMIESPKKRIKEDPLRILRAIRFRAKYGFSIDAKTKQAILESANLLSKVSSERVRNELNQILVGNGIDKILIEYKVIFASVIKELGPTIGFKQRNPYHKNDIYTHLANTCANIEPNYILRLAAILHDIAKPECFSIDDAGVGHFYKHEVASAKSSVEILKRLKYSNEEIKKIELLILYHDCNIGANKKSVKKMLNRLNGDVDLFYSLIKLINADRKDHTVSKVIDMNIITNIVDEIKKEDSALTRYDLKINGYDLKGLGLEGIEIGRMLERLLDESFNNIITNERDILINRAKYLIEKEGLFK